MSGKTTMSEPSHTPNGVHRADNMTGSVPGSRRWMSTVAPLDLES